MRKPKRLLHRVRSVKTNTRLTDFAATAFPILGSRTAAKKAIAAGNLFLNDRPANEPDMVKNGDVIELKTARVQKIKSVDIDLEVIFEDDYLIVVNKPAGIAVNGNRNKTVENAVAGIIRQSPEADALPRPVAVHRIDVPTKGLVLLAKTKSALIQLSKAFEYNQIKKTYIAVVHGKMNEKGRIEAPIQTKRAVTDFQTLKVARSQVFKYFSLVELQPVTGRTHQLRIHLNDLGNLIVGDKEYARRQKTILGKGLFLCACQLSFTHPITKEKLDLQIDPPARFRKLLQREEERFKGGRRR